MYLAIYLSYNAADQLQPTLVQVIEPAAINIRMTVFDTLPASNDRYKSDSTVCNTVSSRCTYYLCVVGESVERTQEARRK